MQRGRVGQPREVGAGNAARNNNTRHARMWRSPQPTTRMQSSCSNRVQNAAKRIEWEVCSPRCDQWEQHVDGERVEHQGSVCSEKKLTMGTPASVRHKPAWRGHQQSHGHSADSKITKVAEPWGLPNEVQQTPPQHPLAKTNHIHKRQGGCREKTTRRRIQRMQLGVQLTQDADTRSKRFQKKFPAGR